MNIEMIITPIDHKIDQLEKMHELFALNGRII
jgi:hypothetical protein